MKKKIFFFDIDGTLLPIGKNHVLNSTRYAIRQLQENGHEVYIATGKAHSDTKWLGEILNINNYLTANGQVVYKNDQIIAEEYLPLDEIKKVVESALRKNTTIGFQGNDDSAVIRGNNYDMLCKFFEHVNIPIPKNVTEFNGEFNVTQLWLAGIDLDLDLPEGLRCVNWPETGCDIVFNHASKGNSILKNFDKNEYEMYAFGDGDNDIEMFKQVDHAIAMGNASDHVKSFASTITDNADSDGIYNYLVNEGLIKAIEPKKLCFIDIDGTLLVPRNHEIDNKVVEAVKKLRANNIEPLICTGRSYHSAKKYIDLLEMDSYITSNGQEVVYKGETLSLDYIQEDEYHKICNIIDELGVARAYETREQIYLPESENANLIQEAIVAQGYFDAKISATKHLDGVFQVWAFGTKEEVDSVQNAIKNDYKFYRWEDSAIEIVATKTNKAIGIQKLLNNFEGYAKTYAFGDGSNDIDMMDIADVSVAMGNAIDDLKEVCDFTTTDCQDNGLVDAFIHLGLIGE